MILILGIPHGACDVPVWRAAADGKTERDFHVFLARYVGLALEFLGLWSVAPELALPAFLLISIVHFADDWKDDLPGLPRIAVAGAMLCATAVFHRDEVSSIFGWLAPEGAALLTGQIMAILAIPLLQASAMIIGFLAMKSPGAALEIAMILLAALLLQPLTFFLLYFCGVHSIRHTIQALKETNGGVKRLAVAAAPYALIAIVGTIVGALTAATTNPGSDLLSAVFMTLAALTVPHMVLMHDHGASGEKDRQVSTWTQTDDCTACVGRAVQAD